MDPSTLLVEAVLVETAIGLPATSVARVKTTAAAESFMMKTVDEFNCQMKRRLILCKKMSHGDALKSEKENIIRS